MLEAMQVSDDQAQALQPQACGQAKAKALQPAQARGQDQAQARNYWDGDGGGFRRSTHDSIGHMLGLKHHDTGSGVDVVHIGGDTYEACFG